MEILRSFTPKIEQRSSALKPAVSRVRNRIAAGTLMVLASLSSACGKVTTEENIIIEVNEDIGCTPVPECPEPKISIFGGPKEASEKFYIQSQRWFRINPETEEIIKVCDPTPRDYCEEGENPQEDGCDPPLCEGVQEAMCDPVPSLSPNGPYRFPSQANYPTGPISQSTRIYIYNNLTDNPIIFDNVSDCGPDESPNGETYYSCDVIPTCEETIPYCDPLPRCKAGQSPIACTEEPGQKFSSEEQCTEFLYGEVQSMSHDFSTSSWFSDLECKMVYDESINENVYKLPNIEVVCKVTPECQEGEIPEKTTRTVPIDCGEWGSFSSVDEYAATCDPIKSCDSQ